MITDHIRNRKNYYCLGKAFQQALDYFATVPNAPLEKKDILLPKSNILVKVRPMMTRLPEECRFEAHRNDADIHFVAFGRERIGYADANRLKTVDVDPEKDMVTLEGEGDLITLYPGYFMIAFPDDAHMPCVCVDEPATLGKMIAKIRV